MKLYTFSSPFFRNCLIHRPHVGKFTLKNALSSIKLAKIKNTAYIKRHTLPTRLSNWNLFNANATYSNNKDDNKDIALYSIPAEFIPT